MVRGLRFLALVFIGFTTLMSPNALASSYSTVNWATDLVTGGAYASTASAAIVNFTAAQDVAGGLTIAGRAWDMRCLSFTSSYRLNGTPTPPSYGQICFPKMQSGDQMLMHDELYWVDTLQPSPYQYYLVTFVTTPFDASNGRYLFFAGNVAAVLSDQNAGSPSSNHNFSVMKNLGMNNFGISEGMTLPGVNMSNGGGCGSSSESTMVMAGTTPVKLDGSSAKGIGIIPGGCGSLGGSNQ